MKKLIIIAFCTLLTFSYCSTEFIDRPSETDLVADNFFSSEEDIQLALNGIYSSLQSYNDDKLVVTYPYL